MSTDPDQPFVGRRSAQRDTCLRPAARVTRPASPQRPEAGNRWVLRPHPLQSA